MNFFLLTFLIIIQLIFFAAGMVVLLRSFNAKHRFQDQFKNKLIGFEAVYTVILFFSFLFHQISSFDGEPAFSAFTYLTGVSCFFFWTFKITFRKNIFLKSVRIMFLGCFFWLSFLTTIKFIPYCPLVWFPLFGVFASTPLFISIISLSEIRYQSLRDNGFKFFQILLMGLIPLVLLNFSLNSFFDENNLSLKMFDPINSKTF